MECGLVLDQVCSLLNALHSLLDRDPRVQYLMTTAKGSEMLKMVIYEYDHNIQKQAIDLLKMLWHYKTNIDVR